MHPTSQSPNHLVVRSNAPYSPKDDKKTRISPPVFVRNAFPLKPPESTKKSANNNSSKTPSPPTFGAPVSRKRSLLADDEIDPVEEYHMKVPPSNPVTEERISYIQQTCLPLHRQYFHDALQKQHELPQRRVRPRRNTERRSTTATATTTAMRTDSTDDASLLLQATPSQIAEQERILAQFAGPSPETEQQIAIPNGPCTDPTNVRIFGQERVYQAMDQGAAIVVRCVGCSKHMLATVDVKLVYCPNCGTLSPIDLAHDGTSPMDVDGGGPMY